MIAKLYSNQIQYFHIIFFHCIFFELIELENYRKIRIGKLEIKKKIDNQELKELSFPNERSKN